MIGIVLFGYGQMGHQIESIIDSRDDVFLYQVYDQNGLVKENTGAGNEAGAEAGAETHADKLVVIDFSHFKMHDQALVYAKEHNCGIVAGTTGLQEYQVENLKAAGEEIPVCYSTNYSYGVLALKKVLAKACEYLGDWDIELIESHHNKKQDAPSGTAKTLLEIIGAENQVYGREGQCPRKKGDVGVHAIRGGTEAGMHQVQFWGDNEMIEIKHHAQSRRIFANGAVIAATVLPEAAGYYTFEDIVE